MRSPEPLPPSPFVEPEKNRYKEKDHERVEKLLEKEFNDKQKLEQYAKNFFHIDVEDLSEEELQKFKIFAVHAIKRILNADSQKYDGLDFRLLATDLGAGLTSGFAFPAITHDLAHAAGMILSDRYKKEGNSIVPPFFKIKKGFETNNQKLFEDELYAGIWSVVYKQHAEINVLLEAARSTHTFEEFIAKYTQNNLAPTLNHNKDALYSVARKNKVSWGKDTWMFITSKHKEARDLAAVIQKNPPADLIKILSYVWENRENPRVLADLFFKEVGPYIEGLQKRKVYRPKTI